MGLFRRRKSDKSLSPPPRDLITDPAQIMGLLQRLQQKRAPLKVRAGDLNDEFSSMLLHISEAKGRMALDQLYPIDGDSRIEIGSSLLANGKLEGVDTRFGVIVERVFQHEGNRIYQAELPEVLHYLQRRAAFRAVVPPEVQLAASRMQDINGAQLRAQLVDVSSSGIGAMITSGIPVPVGEYLACELNLPGGRLSAEVQVRASNRVLGNRRIGALFKGLSDRQRDYLDKVVAHFQRVSLRRRSGQ